MRLLAALALQVLSLGSGATRRLFSALLRLPGVALGWARALLRQPWPLKLFLGLVCANVTFGLPGSSSASSGSQAGGSGEAAHVSAVLSLLWGTIQ